MSTPRPLSPHLQVYRPQLTSVLSVLHRATGIVSVFGAIMIGGWIVCMSMGPDIFSRYQDFLSLSIGKLVLIVLTFSMFFHLLNGVRHLFWDIGWGFRLERTYLTGWIVITLSIVLTMALWLSALIS